MKNVKEVKTEGRCSLVLFVKVYIKIFVVKGSVHPKKILKICLHLLVSSHADSRAVDRCTTEDTEVKVLHIFWEFGDLSNLGEVNILQLKTCTFFFT